MSEPGAVWADEPIESPSEDLLGRQSFVARMITLLTSATSTLPSVVFAVVGPWGSGKSSVLNLLEGQLPAPWVMSRFTPWAASDLDALLHEFFAALGSALPAKRGGVERWMGVQESSSLACVLSALWVRPLVR